MLGDSLNFDEIVNKLNEQDNEIQAQVNVIKGYQERNEKLFKETQELQKRIDRQAELLQKQGEKIDNFIDIKAKLDGKIQEYTTKSEEYELSACSCGLSWKSPHDRLPCCEIRRTPQRYRLSLCYAAALPASFVPAFRQGTLPRLSDTRKDSRAVPVILCLYRALHHP